MKLKQASTNGIILLVSVTIGLLLCEAGARLFLNPADYLSVKTVPDEVLGIVVPPKTNGFDEWGFRNKGVPSTVDVVAIGDSHTYGNNATMEDSWPYVLGRLTGLSVYNLGLGGYGPNQYYHLLKTRALTLGPRWVLCGLYMGDDFENAFSISYGMDYWSFLREGDWDGVVADIWEAPDNANWHKNVRVWLSRNSIIYRLVFHGPILGKVKGAIQIRQASRDRSHSTTSLIVAEESIEEAFRPIGIRDRLDQSSTPVREGMRITFALLELMDEICRENGCQFVVVLIPTKESVFSDYLLGNPEMHLREVIEELVIHEEAARKELLEFLDQARIPYVDTLPALRRAVTNQLYTRSDRDMHPGRNGYRVIGEAVAEFPRIRAKR